MTDVDAQAAMVRALLAETMPCPHEVFVEDGDWRVRWSCPHETCDRTVHKAITLVCPQVACFDCWIAGADDELCDVCASLHAEGAS